MIASLPRITLCRHGQTAWTVSRQHTGRTDIPLTEAGREEARHLGRRLAGRPFNAVWCSPSSRAHDTCVLAGYGGQAVIKEDLAEWDYGTFDGLTSLQIRETRQNWSVYDDGAPGGETVADVQARAGRVVAELRAHDGDVLIFSSGHFLRSLAAVWLGLPASAGRHLLLSTASLSELSYEHTLAEPVILRWNESDQTP